MNGTCPRPDKKALTSQEAQLYAERDQARLNPDIRPYACVCGAWHVGKSRAAFDKRVAAFIKASDRRNARNNRRAR